MDNTGQQHIIANKGWKITTVIFVVLSAILIGTSTFLTIKTNQPSNNLSTSENDKITKIDSNTTPTEDCGSTENPHINYTEYIVLPEIGLKIKTKYATKLAHGWSGYVNEKDEYTGGEFVDWVVIYAQKHLFENPECEISIAQINRLTGISESSEYVKPIGDYWFRLGAGGGIGRCSDADLQLLRAVSEDVRNMDNWEIL